MAFDTTPGRDDGSTVRLNVDISELSRLETAEREWAESTRNMTREALKLDLAQERLKKSLANYGAESTQAKRATIALKDAEEAAARAANKQEHETEQLARATGRLRVGNVSLTRSVAGLAGAYVGVYGLVSATRSVLAAAKEEELVHGQTKVALDALGLSYDAHEARIQRVIQATSRLGFDDEELLKSFQMLVRGTGDVDLALERVGLAADVARGRYIDLEAATAIVNKAQLGMGGTLRRLGIDAEKGASALELIALLQKNYGAAAEEASDTGVAAQDRLNVAWENAQEVIGSGLLPKAIELSNWAERYLSDQENMEQLQERVNSALETGEDVVRGIAGAFDFLNTTLIEPLKKLGLLEEAVTAALILGIVGKTRRAAASFGLIAAASQATTAKVVRDAAIAGRALDAAYRPRAVTAVPGAPVPGGGRGVPLLGVSPGTAVVGGVAILGYLGIRSGRDGILDDPGDMAKVLRAARQGRLTGAQLEELRPLLTDEQYQRIRQAILNRSRAQSDQQAPPRGEGRPTAPLEDEDGGGRRGPTLEDLLLNVARPGNERADLVALRAFYARQIQALEQKKNLSDEQKAKLRGLYGDIAGVQAELDAMEEAEEQRIADQRERAAERRRQQRERQERQREARERREQQEFDRFERSTRARDLRRARGMDPLAGFGGGQGGQRRAQDRARQREREDEDRLTRDDLNRIISGFLSSFMDLQRNQGSNFDRLSQMELVHLNRQQLAEVRTIRGGTQAHEHFQAKAFAGAGFDGMY